ncbi:SDR family oxidoreductase, partial [Candidatus Aminicenantes bacterium AC-708-I09]|nr:SDR family oxidoreductase [Candidatus Aminicenantes bacterium AC-708-I09]
CPYGHFTSPYCKTKAEAEMLVREYSKYFPVVILRPGAIYGPDDPMVTLRTLNYAKRNLLFLIDKGKGVFPHVYIDNLNEAIFLAFQSKNIMNETFNILDDELATAYEFFNYFNRIAGKGEIKIFLPYSFAWGLAFLMDKIAKITGIPPLLSWTGLEFVTLKCKFDISKAKKLLGYNPKISLKEGMKRVEIWWKRINKEV